MNNILCKKVIKNKEKLRPIFTKRQISILEKYHNNKDLSNTEKTYLYSKINKKLKALGIFYQEFYVKGKDMIPKRVKKAKEILKDVNKKAFISGSFLYSKTYKDIDIYILSNKRKQYKKGNKDFIFITESDLKKPIFASAFNYSIANFQSPNLKVEKKRSSLDDNILSYQVAIKEILENEEPKELRYLLIEYYLNIKNKLLNSYELRKEYNKIIDSKDIDKINSMFKKIILRSYSHRYIYDIFARYTKKLEKNIKEYSANKNLIIYKELFDEIKDECRYVKRKNQENT